jgi:hypothetical protein
MQAFVTFSAFVLTSTLVSASVKNGSINGDSACGKVMSLNCCSEDTGDTQLISRDVCRQQPMNKEHYAANQAKSAYYWTVH